MKVRKIYNKNENIRNPLCRCGNELSMVEVLDHKAFDRLSSICDDLVVDDEQRIMYVCSKCVPMHPLPPNTTE